MTPPTPTPSIPEEMKAKLRHSIAEGVITHTVVEGDIIVVVFEKDQANALASMLDAEPVFG
jgi:hypothetical protein